MPTDAGDEVHPRRWYSTNLVGLPTAVLASEAFNAHPQPLRIAGVRESAAGLFGLLEACRDPGEARDVFAHFMALSFGLIWPAHDAGGAEARRWKTSYLKLLQGWGMDSNGAAGAVLKGWAESRFGLVPAFHRARLERFPSAAWLRYLEDKAGARWHNNGIWQQLDLLFEYGQWMLRRFPLLPGDAGADHVTLWRGSTQAEEQIVSGSLRERHCVVRLNSVVSFSTRREQAECFGDWVFRAEVPLAKVVYAPGMLDTRSLQGEAEVVALGGDYRVEARYD